MPRQLLTLLSLFLLAGCADQGGTPSPWGSRLSPLQIRELQSATFEVVDPGRVMKVVRDVFRDETFVIESFDKELGLINASRAVHLEKKSQAREAFQKLGLAAKAEKHFSIDAAVTTEKFGDGVRVRTTFMVRVLSRSGKVENILPVESAEYYRDFFRKVEKGLFLESQNL